MLYNRDLVKDKKPISREGESLIKRFYPFRFRIPKVKESIRDWFDKNCRAHTSLGRLRRLAFCLSRCLEHDEEKREHEGIRWIEEVWQDQKGHCIEQNTFLYTAAGLLIPEFRGKGQWILAKNPRNYNKPLRVHDIGIHSFWILDVNGKKYRADAVDGSVVPLDFSDFDAHVFMNNREFTGFWLQDAAEDLAMNHKKYKDGLTCLELALKCDPNNYTIPATAGWIYNNMEDYGKARRCFQMMLDMAPDIADTWKEYGDFMLYAYGRKEASHFYKQALERDTNDLQVLASLKKRLSGMGRRKQADEAYKKWLGARNKRYYRD